jgi:small subunit ribosomal protein S20
LGTKSAIRSARQAQRRRTRTRAFQTAVKSTVSHAHRLLAAGDKAAPEAVLQAIRTLDRASGKGIIHPNVAARHKSHLVKELNLKPGAK